MLEQGFNISITTDSVEVSRGDAERQKGDAEPPQRGVVLASIVLASIAILIFYWLVLRSSHGDASAWKIVTTYPASDRDFGSSLAALLAGVAISGPIFLAGVRVLFPSGCALRCDRHTFTVSKIPWLNLRGKWVARSYRLSEVSELRFGEIYSAHRGGSDTYGLHFLIAGKKQRLFAGLEAPEAAKILEGFRNLGASVAEDPDMPSRVEETLRQRSMRLDTR